VKRRAEHVRQSVRSELRAGSPHRLRPLATGGARAAGEGLGGAVGAGPWAGRLLCGWRGCGGHRGAWWASCGRFGSARSARGLSRRFVATCRALSVWQRVERGVWQFVRTACLWQSVARCVCGNALGNTLCVERGYAMGAARAQAYGPPTRVRGAQGVVPSINTSACGPNCARAAPIVFAPWLAGCARGWGGAWGCCRCRPVGRQIFVRVARLRRASRGLVGIVWAFRLGAVCGRWPGCLVGVGLRVGVGLGVGLGLGVGFGFGLGLGFGVGVGGGGGVGGNGVSRWAGGRHPSG